MGDDSVVNANAWLGHRVLIEEKVSSRNRHGPGPDFRALDVTLRIEGVVESWRHDSHGLWFHVTGIPGEFSADVLIDLGPFDYVTER